MFDIKKFLAYLIITVVFGGCVGGIVVGIVLGGWQAFLIFLTALGIMVIGISVVIAVCWAIEYVVSN